MAYIKLLSAIPHILAVIVANEPEIEKDVQDILVSLKRITKALKAGAQASAQATGN